MPGSAGQVRIIFEGHAGPLAPEAQARDAVAEVTGPDFPGERLAVCLNPRLREGAAPQAGGPAASHGKDAGGDHGRCHAPEAGASEPRPDHQVPGAGGANRRKMEKHFCIAVHAAISTRVDAKGS